MKKINNKNYNTPLEIAEFASNVGYEKTSRPQIRQFLLAIMAGAFIAFAAQGSNMAAFNLLSDPNTYGLGKFLSGIMFGTGLMLVIIAGGELFTGNSLLIISVLDKKISASKMLKNWLIVFIGNSIGALIIAFMTFNSGQLDSANGLLGGMTIRIAATKTGLSFESAFILGVLCNWLVCLAILMSYAAKDIAGKILSIFFVICLFVVSGFEHSIANMYYIPIGIMAKLNPAWVEKAQLSAEQLENLNWKNLFSANLLPVTLGNIVGGVVFVGVVFWFIYLKKGEKNLK